MSFFGQCLAHLPPSQILSQDGNPLYSISEMQNFLGPVVDKLATENAELERKLQQSSTSLREALDDANGLKLLHSEMRKRQLISKSQTDLESSQV